MNVLVRMLIQSDELIVVDGSNAQPRGEKGNRVTVVVASRCVLHRYSHLFGHPSAYFLVVDCPKYEDLAICDVLMRVKTGKTVWVVTGDTKPDPIMVGALNAANRGCHVHVFTRHHNTSTTNKWTSFHNACHNHAQEAKKGGSLTVHGFCEGTPRSDGASASV
jgi:hypothetical protein